jgi:CRISPR-associated endonuclease/helicase Cas3
MAPTDFDTLFHALTGNPPFPWQRQLYRRLVAGDPPVSCNLPTGLGKTAVLHLWLLALAARPEAVPRRLVYVVNRRTVVDQATREAEKLRERLPQVPAVCDALLNLCAQGTKLPLAISTLRGQFADNGEWRADPARPAVIVGTVDMIGSRLLFSGYGCGFKSRPLHAGFLGQDVLLVHDEAHLEPAFQDLVLAIQAEQERCRDLRPLRVMELTATSRDSEKPFGLTPEDRDDKEVQKRIGAKKQLLLHEVPDDKSVAERVLALARVHEPENKAVLIFLRRVEDVEKVAGKLPAGRVERLTGTLRGHERDRLATENKVFARFLPSGERAGREQTEGTVYLVCTSAGEVGVNISADHLVCDLTPLDSMAQRFGRVNRFGEGAARLDVVHPAAFDDEDDYDIRRHRTLQLLRRLGEDASPAALGRLRNQPDLPCVFEDAFSPRPESPLVTDILFDTWALTSVRGPLPGRPPVEDWLHGRSERELPDTYVAWREEVGRITGALLEEYPPADLLDDYPLKPHELLRDRTDRVAKHLAMLAKRTPDLPAWVVEPDGEIRWLSLAELTEEDKQKRPAVDLRRRTVVLPPAAGGLNNGMLDGEAVFDPAKRAEYDVADRWFEDREQQRPYRARAWDDEQQPLGMRLVRTLELETADSEAEGESEAPARMWRWYVRPRAAGEEAGSSGLRPCPLERHNGDAGHAAAGFVSRLCLPEPLGRIVELAARCHDLGKARAVWQRGIGNTEYDPERPATALAKSGHRRPPEDLNRYRHEFGSLLDVLDEATEHGQECARLAADERELLLHLIAAHHGRARPHFEPEEAFDPERPVESAEELAREVPRRFARLQRRYGRWGLAYLESLVRAADILASQPREEEQP